MAIERNEIVTFTTQHLSYFTGESAAFTAEEAAHLAELGVINTTATESPPVNVDVPHASFDGTTANCTMGNWVGIPNAYAYQWHRDGTDIDGAIAADYATDAADLGTALTCTVTATNAAGSTAAPPSNAIDVPAAARGRAPDAPDDPTHETRPRHRR